MVNPMILCAVARAQNMQYTKPLLLEAADPPKSERSEAAICELIGCLDPRTADESPQPPGLR